MVSLLLLVTLIETVILVLCSYCSSTEIYNYIIVAIKLPQFVYSNLLQEDRRPDGHVLSMKHLVEEEREMVIDRIQNEKCVFLLLAVVESFHEIRGLMQESNMLEALRELVGQNKPLWFTSVTTVTQRLIQYRAQCLTQHDVMIMYLYDIILHCISDLVRCKCFI